MNIGLNTIKNYIYKALMILSAIYLLLRVASIILVKGFGFTIFSRTYEINLWNIAPSIDIIMSAICFTVSFIYFTGIKRVVISLTAFLLLVYSLFAWFPMIILSQSLTPIESPFLNDNYAIYQYSYPGHPGKKILHIIVYKERYPLLYKPTVEESKMFSRKHDRKTIESFEKRDYKINKNGKTLYYGRMEISLEKSTPP